MGEPARHPRGMLPPGTRVGRYELVRRLAKGGMAELYLARAHGIHGFEKLVVLKLVLPYLAEDRDFVEMFLHEARLAATLDHPNIVHVTDIGEVEGEPFFVMEYVHGQDVRAIMRAASKSGKSLPLSCALTIMAGAATGLHYVHERRGSDGRFLGLVHRDVSPANVVVSYDGSVKLVDFGIAKATELRQSTRSGVLKGKVNYMAPEQCHGVAVDRRTDVFALGILLYETTTGKRLFAGDSDFYVMSRIVRGLFAKPTEVKPDLPPELEAIILRALATDPADRHPTAQDLLADLEGFAHDHRLRLSALPVADFLRDLFGEQPHPATEEDELPTMVHPDAPGSGPRSSGAEVIKPTAVTGFSEATTNVVPSTSSGTLEVGQKASAPGADAPTRVLGPLESTAEVTAAVPASPASTIVVPPKTEPTPRVVLNPSSSPQVATVPTPRVVIAARRRRGARKSIGLVVGLAVAAIVAFGIGVSAGTRQRANQAATSDPPTVSEPTPPASAAPPEPSVPTSEPESATVAPRDPPGDGEEAVRAPPDGDGSESAAPATQRKPAPRTTTTAKKKRPRKKPTESKKPSGLDAMYPSTSRSER